MEPYPFVFGRLYPLLTLENSSPSGTAVDSNTILLLTFRQGAGLDKVDFSDVTLRGAAQFMDTTDIVDASHRIVITPLSPLSPGETYVFTAMASAFENADGIAYGQEISFDFTVEYAPLTEPIIRPNNQQQIPVDTAITIDFQVNTGLIVEDASLIQLLQENKTPVAITLNLSGSTVTLQPNTTLLPGKTYVVNGAANAFKNGDNLFYAHEIQSSFKTAHSLLTPPTTEPMGSKIEPTNNIQITFNAGAGLQVIDPNGIVVKQNGTEIHWISRIDDASKLVLTVEDSLARGKTYVVKVTSDSFANGDGVAYQQDISYSFKTAYAPLNLLRMTPSGNANPTNAPILLTFGPTTAMTVHNSSGIHLLDSDGNELSYTWDVATENQLRLQPTSLFLLGQTYTIQIDANTLKNGDDVFYDQEIRYDFGIQYTEIIQVATQPQGDTIPVSSDIQITFNDNTGTSFLDSSFLTIQKQANADAVLFDVNIEDEHRIVLNPSNDLEAGTTYVVRSPSGTFQNGNNLPYTNNIVFSFTTAFLLLLSPTNVPVGNAVATNSDIRITFSGDNYGLNVADASRISLQADGTTLSHTTTIQDQKSLLIQSQGGLLPGTSYTVAVLSGALQNGDDQPYNSSINYAFRTAYETLTLQATKPSRNVADPMSDMQIIFNSNTGLVIQNSATIRLTDSSSNEIAHTVSLANNRQIVLRPTGGSSLQYGETYTITVPANSLVNGDAVSYAQDITYTFSVLYLPLTSPTLHPQGTEINVGQNIRIAFRAGTGLIIDDTNMIEIKSGEQKVAFDTSLSGGNTVVFNPSNDLSPGTSYTVTVPVNTLKNGNNLFYSEQIEFSFQTAYISMSSPTTSPSGSRASTSDPIQVSFAQDTGMKIVDSNGITISAQGVIQPVSSRIQNGNTLLIAVRGGLTAGTTYEVRITANSLANGDDTLYGSDTVYSFTTAYKQLTPVSVQPTGPRNSLSADMIIGFNDHTGLIIDNPSGITLTDSNGLNLLLSSSVNTEKNALLIDPSSPFILGESYTVTVRSGSLKNADNIFYNQQIRYTFGMRYPSLSTPIVQPQGNGASLSSSLTISFDPGAGLQIDQINGIQLRDQNGADITFATTIAGTTTAVITPDSSLTPGTTYTLSVLPNTFKNGDDMFYAPAITFGFTTIYDPLLTPITTSPTGSGISIATDILLTFPNRPGVQVADSSLINVRSNTMPLSIQTSSRSASELLILVNGGLVAGTTYYVELQNGALQNGDSVAYLGNISYSFTTVYAPLTLQDTRPAGNMNPTNTEAVIEFNDNTGLVIDDPSGIQIQDSHNNSIVFTMQVVGDNQVVLSAPAPFTVGERYTVIADSNSFRNGDNVLYTQEIRYTFGISFLPLTTPTWQPTGVGVPVDTNVAISFNTGTGLVLPDPSLIDLKYNGTNIPFVSSVDSGYMIVINPDADMQYGKEYELIAPPNTFFNGNNVSYPQEIRFVFTTAHRLVAVPSSTQPTGVGVSLTTPIILTFQTGTGIRIANQNGIQVQTNGIPLVTSARTLTTDSLQIDVSGGLSPGILYEVSLETNSLQNGNNVLYASPISYTFRTTYDPLSLVSTSPSTSNVDVNDNIILQFGGGLPVSISDVTNITIESGTGSIAFTASIQSNSNVVLMPTSNLSDGTTYTVQATSSTFKNNDDLFYNINIDFTFTTTYALLSSPSRFPTGSGAAANTDIELTFASGSGVFSDDYSQILLTEGPTPISRSVSLQGGNTVLIEPTSNLQNGVTYTLTVPANTLKNGDDHTYNQAIFFSFTTEYLPIQLVSTAPMGNTADINATPTITLNNESGVTIDNPSGISITDSSNVQQPFAASLQNASEIILTPDTPLKYGETYTVKVDSNSLKNGDDVFYNQEILYLFTTGYASLVAPTITPNNATTNVPLTNNITLTFPVGTGLVLADVNRIEIEHNGGNVSFVATIEDDNKLILNPTVNLLEGTTYTISVAANALRNGNNLLYAQSIASSFTTTYPVLQLVMTSPAAGDTVVDTSGTIQIEFNAGAGLNIGNVSSIQIYEDTTSLATYSLSIQNGNTVQVDFTTPLNYGKRHLFQALVGAFENGDGVAYSQAIAVDFTTAYNTLSSYTVSPSMTSGVPHDVGYLAIVFPEGSGLNDPVSSSITFQQSSFLSIAFSAAVINGHELRITPDSNLDPGNVYEIQIASASLSNGDNIVYANPIQHTFITAYAPLSAPTISPIGVGASIDTDITLTFVSNAGLAINNSNLIRIQGNSGIVSFATRIEHGNQLILSPNNPLEMGMGYTVSVYNNALKNGDDLLYNALISFVVITDAPAPVLQRHTPIDQAQNIPMNLQQMELVFDRAVQAGTGTISLSGTSSLSGTDSHSLSATTIVVDTHGSARIPIPNTLLAYNSLYTVSIPAGALQASYSIVNTPATDIRFQFQTVNYFSRLSGPLNPIGIVNVDYDALPAFADLNGDSDPDLVIGSRDGKLRYYQNVGTATSPSFIEITGSGNPFNGIDVGDHSAPSLVDVDRDNDIDLVVGNSAGEISYYENTGSRYSATFVLQTGAADPFDGVDVGGGSASFPSNAPASIGFGDIDGDNDLDAVVGFYVSANNYQVRCYRNDVNTVNSNFTALTGSSNPFNGILLSNFILPRLMDVDGDNDADLFYGVWAQQDMWYHPNTGGRFSASYNNSPAAGNNSVLSVGAIGTHLAPAFIDMDGDGDLDIAVGDEDGNLHYYRRN